MIRGQQVYLRPAEREDLPHFVRWLNDGETSRDLAIRSPLSLALEESWFERLLQDHGRSRYHFVICLRADGRAIGAISLEDVDRENGNAAFGIVIGEPDDWGKGYGTEATRAICDFAFGELRLERVYLDVYASNPAGRRVYEKAGFVHEGTQRHTHFARGTFHDVHRMAILRDEWLAQERPRSWEL